MANVSYLFGAGASREAVPLVAEIPSRLLEFIDQLRLPAKALSDSQPFNYRRHEHGFPIKMTKRQLQLELINELNWLHGLLVAQPKLSIDTIAKQLSIKEKNEDLGRLKKYLSIFLTVEQIIYGRNARYDSFFASIINGTIKDLPRHIKIISWNYDYQFELAFNELSEFNDLKKNQDFLGVVSKNSSNRQPKKNGFEIFKINGTASFIDTASVLERNDLHIFKKQGHTIELIEDIVRYYSVIRYSDKLAPLLSFAWESDKGGSLIDAVIKRVKKTEKLVIIGYSFPEFNRPIDTKILKSLSSLNTIYIQTLESDMNETEKRLRARIAHEKGLKIVQEPFVNQFLIP